MPDTKAKPVPKKPATRIPPGIAQDIENMRKDKLVDDEYKAGEKARKANMGKAGFKRGGAIPKMIKTTATRRK